jgi:hypothetical protein
MSVFVDGRQTPDECVMSVFVDGRQAPVVGRRALIVGAASGAAGLSAGVALGGDRAGAASLPDGLEVVAVPARVRDHRVAFDGGVRSIYARHWEQTAADVAALREKCATPVFGTVDPTELVDELAAASTPPTTRWGTRASTCTSSRSSPAWRPTASTTRTCTSQS